MALLDTPQGQQQQQSSGGLLADDPMMGMMVVLSLINKFTGDNRGAESGFGDIFGAMAAMQQAEIEEQRYQEAQQLERARFGLEQNKYNATMENYKRTWADLDRQAQEAAQQRQQYDQLGQGVMNYQAPVAPMRPVIPEYQQMPLGNQNFAQIPTDSYIKDISQAGAEAAATPRRGAFVDDPQLRQQMADLIRTGDPQNVKYAYDTLQQGGPFTLNNTRYTGTGDVIVKDDKQDLANLPTGYQWADATNPAMGLKPIPGGPAEKVDANEAGRQQMVNSALGSLDKVIGSIIDPNTGNIDRTMVATMYANVPFTSGRTARAQIEDAIAAKLRLETGAQANAQEIVNMRDRFLPTPFDADETIKDKLSRFQQFMRGSSTQINKRYGGQQPQQQGQQQQQGQRQAAFSEAQLNAMAKEAIESGRDPQQVAQMMQQLRGQ